jgi:hypothetical protein
MTSDCEIRAISRLCPSVFSSFAYSFFPMKAYTNPHKATLTINDIAYAGLKTFHAKAYRSWKKEFAEKL